MRILSRKRERERVTKIKIGKRGVLGRFGSREIGSWPFIAGRLKIALCVKKVGSGRKCDWLLDVFYKGLRPPCLASLVQSRVSLQIHQMLRLHQMLQVKKEEVFFLFFLPKGVLRNLLVQGSAFVTGTPNVTNAPLAPS